MLILYAAAAAVAVLAEAAAAVAEGRAEEGRQAGGSWSGQVRVARNDSGAGAGRGKVSAENWRVKEFKRREQKKETRKKTLIL